MTETKIDEKLISEPSVVTGEEEAVEKTEEEKLEATAEENGIDLVEEEAPDDKKDVFWALLKPIEEMTLEEQFEAIRKIREMRKVRIASTKKKSDLDNLLSQLTPERASSLLKQIESLLDSSGEKKAEGIKQQ